MEIAIVIFLAIWFGFGYFGYRIMKGKGRSGFGGFLLGMILGIIGLILALMMRPSTEAEAMRQMEIEVKKREALERMERGGS